MHPRREEIIRSAVQEELLRGALINERRMCSVLKPALGSVTGEDMELVWDIVFDSYTEHANG